MGRDRGRRLSRDRQGGRRDETPASIRGADPAVDSPAEDLIEIVDRAGRAIGAAGKLAGHRAPGRLHRAVSVFVLDADDRLVLQRRAFAKYHSGGRWSNTCCGHPRPGEAPERAARRRLADELGIDLAPGSLVEAGTVRYEVADPPSGLVEREYNHVFVGRAASRLVPNPDEVAELALVGLEDLDEFAASRPADAAFSAWFPLVHEVARPALRALIARPPD